MNPRYAFAIGALFLVTAVIYGLLSRDTAGATMLGALAIGMGVMSYVLLAGSPRGSA
jgi:hypothetical protein